MKRSRTIMLAGVPIIASVLAGCGEPTPTHLRVCRDEQGQVVEDARCEQQPTTRAGGTHVYPLWWYMPYIRGGYPIGSALRGGSEVSPRPGPNVRVTPNQTARGGFGATGSGRSSTGA
jgi:hypothetical protein